NRARGHGCGRFPGLAALAAFRRPGIVGAVPSPRNVRRRRRTMADWIEAGKRAPDFTLPSDRGTKVKLSGLRGQPVVLYFYPRDETPGCTREACAFRDRKTALAKLGAQVLGVSTDDVASHARFRDKHELNFPLLADVDHEVAEKYGAWRE